MSWSKDNYLTKASLYWGKATSNQRDSLEYFLYFALFAEHVIRATLVHVNPVLNAAKDDESVLYGAGISATTAPKTVELSKAVSWLKRLIPNIGDEEFKAIALLIEFRNTEFHDDTSRFDLAVLTKIIPQCQVFITRLFDFSETDAVLVIGDGDAAQFKAIAAAKNEDRIRRVKSMIEVTKDRFYHLSKEDQEQKRQDGHLKFKSLVMTSGRHLKAHQCPSCSGLGALSGLPYGRSAPMLIDGDLVEEVRVIPVGFECKICELTVTGLDELLSAQFPHEFTSLQSVDVVDHFGINVEDYIDVEQIAQRYHEDYYGYQDE
ncbi:hypothetical protein [Aquidulcibacter sp.]|uniref:hypothetical protein n=1 Tax=Aquidulcibacter sp. TaxID=2052990 RepID=UPI0025C193B9|nr:hypothetical protein [Aquidulcibacter sp.]MCA3696454.1 hypothetical protein [Aquidulcibacter sp.]